MVYHGLPVSKRHGILPRFLCFKTSWITMFSMVCHGFYCGLPRFTLNHYLPWFTFFKTTWYLLYKTMVYLNRGITIISSY